MDQESRPMDLEEGWAFMQKGITKLKNIVEGKPEPQFSDDDYMKLYTTIYNMCTQKAPHDYSQLLYNKYRESFEEYITSTVLPSLKEKHDDELMLRELVLRWSNHKILVRWLTRFFHYLDRYFIPRQSLIPLKEVGLTCFRELVYQEIKGQVKDAVIALIDREREGEGEQIDRALLKNVLDIFVEIGLGQMECYENDFEDFLLKDTTEYYSVKFQSWITKYPSPDYMSKVEECLKREKERVGHYLHYSSEQKLLWKVHTELLARYEDTLSKKERSGLLDALLCFMMRRTYQLSPKPISASNKVDDQLSPVINNNSLEPSSASNELRFSSDDHMINTLDDHSKRLHDMDIRLKSLSEKFTNRVAPEIAVQRACEGIKGSGSVVLVMFARKDKSAFEEYIESLINKSASPDVKRQWKKILQKILKKIQKRKNIYTTGFVVGEDSTCVFILTCVHSVDEVFNKYHPIKAKTIENLYKISVTCDHLEREHRPKKDSNRVFVPAQVMGVSCRKDLLLIKVQKEVQKRICGENHEPLKLAQNLPVPGVRVGMVSWPYDRHATESTGHMSHQERDYSQLSDIFDGAYGYNFTSLEVNIGCPYGSSGGPLVDLAGKVIGQLHGGGPDRFNYFVSLEHIRAFLTHYGVIQEDGSRAAAAATGSKSRKRRRQQGNGRK